MTKFITIQNSYHDVQLALFQDSKILDSLRASKIEASKMLIPLTSQLVQKNSLVLSDLKFIAANRGPGPFTTLRTVLASVNGLAFATKTPLIGIDSLSSFAKAIEDRDAILVVLLNAFNQDVYFLVQNKLETHRGCQKIQTFITELVTTIPNGPIKFVGNGALMHKDLIVSIFGERALFDDPIPEGPSIETIGLMALAKWHRQEDLVGQLMPVYLK